MAERRRTRGRKPELRVSRVKTALVWIRKSGGKENSILHFDCDFGQLSLRAFYFIFCISVFIYGTFWMKLAGDITA